MTYVIFILFGVMVLGGGLLVVLQRNLVHAATGLVLSLFGVAGLFVLLNAGFLAAVQILVYIGAIAILIIFAIMLTRRITDESVPALNEGWGISLVVALATLAILIVLLNSVWPFSLDPVELASIADPTRDLGIKLVSWDWYSLPFEVASVLLLGAMIGSIVIAREKHDSE